MTALLSLPLVGLTIATRTNEDLLDAWSFLDPDDDAYDLSGIAFRSQWRQSAADPQAYISAATADGTMVVGGTGNGVLAYLIPAATMARVPPGTYVADVIGTADGHTRNVAEIAITVKQGITR